MESGTRLTAPRLRTGALGQRIAFGVLLAMSFIGFSWLVDPLCARFGWGGDLSRPHMLFIGAFFGVGMSLLVPGWIQPSPPRA